MKILSLFLLEKEGSPFALGCWIHAFLLKYQEKTLVCEDFYLFFRGFFLRVKGGRTGTGTTAGLASPNRYLSPVTVLRKTKKVTLPNKAQKALIPIKSTALL